MIYFKEYGSRHFSSVKKIPRMLPPAPASVLRMITDNGTLAEALMSPFED